MEKRKSHGLKMQPLLQRPMQADKSSALTSQPLRSVSPVQERVPVFTGSLPVFLKRNLISNGPPPTAIQRQTEEEQEEILQAEPMLQRQVAGEKVKDEPIQTKLEVSNPYDKYEREADRVADQVMRMEEPSPISSSPKIVQRKCAACEAGGSLCPNCAQEETKPIQRKENSSSTIQVKPSIQKQIAGLRGGGYPLSPSMRDYFEPRFGRDFGGVRVHTNNEAAESARTIQAKAFTVGQNMVFGTGHYDPASERGKHLIAHELTHVVQQYGGTGEVLQRQPDAGVGDAGPVDAGGGGQTRQFRGETLSDDSKYSYELLKRMYLAEGYTAMEEFVFSFETEVVLPDRPIAGISEDPEYNRNESILSVLKAQYIELTKERNKYISDFESHADKIARGVLEDSRKHVEAEAVRYGVSNLHLEFSSWWGMPEIKGDVADNASTRGIAIAAQGLLERKSKAEKAMKKYMDFTSGAPAIAELASARFHSQEEEIAKMRADISKTQRDLDVFRIQVQTRFPLLAALSGDEDFNRSALEDLAKGEKGKSSEATAVIVEQIVEKRLNIAKVKEGLDEGDVNLWRVSKIVEATKDALGVKPGTLQAYVIDEKIKDEKPSALTGIFIGLLQIGLVLLAPATGGLTLIPAGAISVGTAYQHFKEYEMKKAMHGTDFGAAALSAEEPSLFWLAVDIVGAGFDVVSAGGAARRIFRELVPAAKAIRSAQVTEDAIRNLERQAADLGGEALARQVGRDARAMGGASRDVGITAEEVRKFEQAATDVAAQELREGVQSAMTIGGGKVTVSRTGALWSCTSPCMMMRERFKDLLAREPKFVERLNSLEARARGLDTGPKGDFVRKQIANEAAALEREMRTSALLGEEGGAVIGRVGRAEFKVSTNAPIDWPIVRIDPKHPPDIVPDGVVLEFPTGERVWRSAGSDRGIVIESKLGRGKSRQQFEAEYYSRGEMELPDYVKSDLERAHSQGAGTGFESPYAIPYAPREVNQTLQNLGIEEFLRELQRNQPEGVVYGLMTNTRVHPDSRRLSLIEYTVTVTYKGERRTLFSTGIRVEGSINKPAVSIANDLTSVHPEAFEMLPLNDLAESMLQRRLDMITRRAGKSK